MLETEAGNPETEISQGSQMTEAETKVTETPVQPTVDIDDVSMKMMERVWNVPGCC